MPELFQLTMGLDPPPAGVLLSALLLGETISPFLWASMGLVAVGIAIVNREGG